MYYYFNKCMMVFVVLWVCEMQRLVWRTSALLLKLSFNNQSESEHPPGINEAPEAAPILWVNQICEDLQTANLNGTP